MLLIGLIVYVFFFPTRYEWVDIGMLGYDPEKKLYLVKRVQMVNLLPEWEKEKLSRLNTPAEGTKPKEPASKTTKRRVSKGSATRSNVELRKTTSDEKLESGPKKSKSESKSLSTPRRRVGHVERPSISQDLGEGTEEGTYWVPRIRLMFAAEDPRVFADRVANAHKTR